MSSTTLAATASQIATLFGVSEDELSRQALVSLLLEKKREVLQLRLDLLTRYGAESVLDLETKIAQGAADASVLWYAVWCPHFSKL